MWSLSEEHRLREGLLGGLETAAGAAFGGVASRPRSPSGGIGAESMVTSKERSSWRVRSMGPLATYDPPEEVGEATSPKS